MLIYNPCPVSYWCPAAWETTAPKLSQTRHNITADTAQYTKLSQYTVYSIQYTVYSMRQTRQS